MPLSPFTPKAPGRFFKFDEFANAVAILVEPLEFAEDVPSDYGDKDQITADLTVFDSEASLQAGVPDREVKRCRIQNNFLVRDLKDDIGAALALKVEKVKTKGQPAPAWKAVPSHIEKLVGEYYDNREAAVQAAVADAPDFD